MDTICIFEGQSHQEALSVKEILESNGIISLMPNENISGVVPYYSLATGGFSIFVSNRQFVEGSLLLNSLGFKTENSKLIDNLEEIKKSKVLEKCPECGNMSVETIVEKRKGLIISMFLLFGIPFDARRYKKICHICNETIKVK